MNTEDMVERARKLIEQDQVQLLTDYEVHPDAWKGDPDRCDAVAALADAILEPAAAEITRLRAALFDFKEILRKTAAAGYKARLDANAAEAERDAARAHNADLSATLEARVQAARAKALEDAAEKCLAHPMRFAGQREDEVRETLALAIRDMTEQEYK